MSEPSSFTGRRRERKTRASIKLMDVVARLLITFGGVGTIVAVMTVALFLVWIVWPLIEPAKVTGVSDKQAPFPHDAIVHLATDDHQTMGFAFQKDGTISVFALKDGEPLETKKVTDQTITAISFSATGERVALGYDNGMIQSGSVRFETIFFDDDDVSQTLADMEPGEIQPLRDFRLAPTDEGKQRLLTAAEARSVKLTDAESVNGTIQVTPKGQYRLKRLKIELDDALETGGEWPIRLVYMSTSGSSPTYVAYNDNSQLKMVKLEVNELFGTSESEVFDLPFEPRPDAGHPQYLLLSSLGDLTLLAWEDGMAQRYHTRNPRNASLVETFDTTEGGAKLTVFDYLLGSNTVVLGDDQGDLSAWFGFKPKAIKARAKNGQSLVVASSVADKVKAKLKPAPVDQLPSHLESYAGALLLNTYPEDVLFMKIHELPKGDSAVTTVSSSRRSRMIAAGYASGKVRIQQITTDQTLITARPPEVPAPGSSPEGAAMDQPVTAVALTPKDDGLIASVGDRLVWWQTDKKYPEATPSSLFLPVWYESYAHPNLVWQSSSGTDDFEMKLSIAPLVFGTLKATFFAMIFAVPLALLAAVYTSEFLHPKAKTKIKPIVEMMASLPSVVLGFLAGLVFAPIIGDAIPVALAVFMTIPLSFLIGAYLWQLLPRATQINLTNMGVAESKGGGETSGLIRALHRAVFFVGGARLMTLLVLLALGFLAAMYVGPLLSNILFGGDVKAWLNYDPYGGSEENMKYASGLGGWVALLWPIGAVVTAILFGRYVNPILRDWGHTMPSSKLGLLEIGKFAIGIVCAILVAVVLGTLLLGIGFDPRGPMYVGNLNVAPMGSYIQRNALIVGIAMGFAVIPIIYTIAEDALSAVPEHLRSASLGCGATPWQTATTIIIPTATSGLFSACMIGLGRAVGETMIVLMALGSTAVLDMNMFNGARPLSANIAIEMPEAVKNSTHYRTLFLCGLTLFVMTFIVNTVAERVRQHFRKKNMNL